MTKNNIVNLQLCIREINGIHPQAYIKQLGIEYIVSIPQSAFEAWWFLGCLNIPNPLPVGLRYIENGYEKYLNWIDNDKKALFIEKMIKSTGGVNE